MENNIHIFLEKIRPGIQTHGGDVRLIKIEQTTVTLKIDGACTYCSLSKMTYNKTVGPLLMREVQGITEVLFE